MHKITMMFGLLVLLMSQSALASDDTRHTHGQHMHGPLHGEKMAADMPARMAAEGEFLVTRDIDGFAVSFHIMPAPKDRQKSGSHDLLIKVERQGKVLSDLAVNSKVIHPNNQSESKMTRRMGDWYMTAYDLGHPGPHQVMVLFKTADGIKHFGGVNYSPADK